MTTVATSYWPADTSEPVLETTVGGILRAAAAAGPDMLAMVGGVPDPGQRRRWTYAELLAEAEQAARALTARFAPGERVAVWAPNLPEWVILEYAAGLAGLVLVTVNPALRPAELAYVLNQSGAAGIFLVPEFRSPMAQFLAEVRPDVPALRDVVFFTEWAEFLGTAPAQAVLPEVRADDIAQIQYTSGTTGIPKGAELHHRGLTNNARFYAGRIRLPARRGVREPDAAVPHRLGMRVLGAQPGRARRCWHDLAVTLARVLPPTATRSFVELTGGPVPIGQAGELCARGYLVMRGTTTPRGHRGRHRRSGLVSHRGPAP